MFLGCFFNIFTLFGMNRTVLQIPPDTIFAISFVLLAPGVTFVFTPGAVPRSVLTDHGNLRDCDAWFSNEWLKNDSTPAASRDLKRKTKYTNYPQTSTCDGITGVFFTYFN